MSISKYYYDISKQPSLKNLFDLPNFLDHVRLKPFLSKTTSAEWDMVKVKRFVEVCISSYVIDTNINEYVKDPNRFSKVLIDICFEVSLLPVIAGQYGQEYNRADSANSLFLKNQVLSLLDYGKNKIDLTDLTTFKDQMLTLPNEMFSFGQRMYPLYQSFDVVVFKTWMIERLFEHFYPVLYFTSVLVNREQCNDFKCRRIYVLAAYMFVYNTIASLFLIIYSSANSIEVFKQQTSVDNVYLETIKFGLVNIMDAILRQLDNENVLDSLDANGKSTLSSYYNQVRTLASNNVMNSNKLNETKNIAQIMQSNLGNYNYNEATNYQETQTTKIIFYVVVAVLVSVIIGLIVLLYLNKFMYVNIICAVVLLGISVYSLASVIMQLQN